MKTATDFPHLNAWLLKLRAIRVWRIEPPAHAMPLAAIVEAWMIGPPGSERAVIITIRDGYSIFSDVAPDVSSESALELLGRHYGIAA